MTPLGKKWLRDSGSVVELRHTPFPIDFLCYPLDTKPGWWRVKIILRVRDRDNSKGVTFTGTFVDVKRRNGMAPTARKCSRLLRTILHDMMAHEMDECIYVNGVRVFEPHKKKARGR